MSNFELVMPKMGESIAEATIITWLKNEGDTIEADESVLEIATDKVDSEVPTPEGGVLVKKLFNDGDVVGVGEVIAIISTSGEATAEAPAPAKDEKVETAAAKVEETVVEAKASTATPESVVSNSEGGRFYSPLVLNIARSEGIPMSELENIPGTGREGRVSKKDILAYVKNGKPAAKTAAPQETKTEAPAPKAQPAATSSTPAAHTAPSVTINEGDEIIEMDRMRKMIADHMVMSKHVSPHVTSFVEADVTELVHWRNGVKEEFKKKEGENITFTPLFIEAVVKAIKDFPMINIAVSGTNIVKRKDINIGMAAALPSGNLIVPVIKKADTKNLLGLTKEVNDLANRARNNKLGPDDIQGGTFTITNVGGFGNVMGTPIINQPQVAILATGSIIKKPAVLETKHGDVIAIRHKMFLSLSYDHRVVDGSLGGSFLRRIADYLEQFDTSRTV